MRATRYATQHAKASRPTWLGFGPALRLPTQAKPTAAEIEMAWVFHGGIFYYGVRRYIYEMPALQEKEEMIANAIDGYLAGFLRMSGQDAKRPTVKSNRLNAAALR